MNLPNQLTLSRVIMIPIFVALLEASYLDISPQGRTLLCALAALVYVIAAITDLVDGYLARRWNQITDFGKLFDPLADKLLVTAALVIFVHRDLFHGWVVVIILSREFIVTGLRSLGERAGRTIAADRWGKAKAISQTAVVLAALAYLIAANAVRMDAAWLAWWGEGSGPDLWAQWFVDGLMFVCLVATVASGVTYLVSHWDLISDQPAE